MITTPENRRQRNPARRYLAECESKHFCIFFLSCANRCPSICFIVSCLSPEVYMETLLGCGHWKEHAKRQYLIHTLKTKMLDDVFFHSLSRDDNFLYVTQRNRINEYYSNFLPLLNLQVIFTPGTSKGKASALGTRARNTQPSRSAYYHCLKLRHV